MANLFTEEAPKGYKGVSTQVAMSILAYTKFLSKTQLVMINQMHAISTRRSLSTAYGIRG